MRDTPGARLVHEAIEIRVRATKLEGVLVVGVVLLLLLGLGVSLHAGLGAAMSTVAAALGKVAGG